jgi:hypothetical protein
METDERVDDEEKESFRSWRKGSVKGGLEGGVEGAMIPWDTWISYARLSRIVGLRAKDDGVSDDDKSVSI